MKSSVCIDEMSCVHKNQHNEIYLSKYYRNSPPFAYSCKLLQPIATTHASSAVLSELQQLTHESCQVSSESVQTWREKKFWLCMICCASLIYPLQMSLANLRSCLKLQSAGLLMREMHRSSAMRGGILSSLILLRLSWFCIGFVFVWLLSSCVCRCWRLEAFQSEYPEEVEVIIPSREE